MARYLIIVSSASLTELRGIFYSNVENRETLMRIRGKKLAARPQLSFPHVNRVRLLISI